MNYHKVLHGRTIMTTEPKFVPNEAVEITVGDNLKLKTRLVDCVGYLVNNAIGYLEDDVPRMVRTPWSEEEIPFETIYYYFKFRRTLFRIYKRASKEIRG